MGGRRRGEAPMRVIPRFVYNPEKAERGLKAMADILAGAVHQETRRHRKEDAPETGR